MARSWYVLFGFMMIYDYLINQSEYGVIIKNSINDELYILCV